MKHKKPTPEDRKNLLWKMKGIYDINKSEALNRLGESCGVTYSTVSKWFFPVASKSYRDCPAAAWRCWSIDFKEVF